MKNVRHCVVVPPGGPLPNATHLSPWEDSLLGTYDSWSDRSRQDLLDVQQRTEERRTLKRIFAAEHTALLARERQLGTNATVPLQRLRDDGLSIGAFGIDWSVALHHHRPDDPLSDVDVQHALALMLGHAEAAPLRSRHPRAQRGSLPAPLPLPSLSLEDRVMFVCDQPLAAQWATCVKRHSTEQVDTDRADGLGARLLEHLSAAGFVRIDDWSALGLDVHALAAEADAILSRLTNNTASSAYHRGRAREYAETIEPLPALDEMLLHGASLAHVVRGYLGSKVRYDSHILKRCAAGPWPVKSKVTFGAGRWHHDRCGRRLKAFIFLTDVDDESHPTRIALHTHRTQYWSHEFRHFALTRFADAHVRAHHKIATLTGSRFGGFIFDTNAVHKIELEGSRSRDVVTLEWHPHGKIPQLRRHNNPCPTRRRRVSDMQSKDSTYNWLRGDERFPYYPAERPW